MFAQSQRSRRGEAHQAEVHDRRDHVSEPGPDRVIRGAGADVMKRIAAPMIGGIFTSFVHGQVVCPAMYKI
jgi:hypothetical protein